MIHGLDTSFLVALELAEHSDNVAAKATFARLVAQNDQFALAPQVLAEFLHVATDARRLITPLTMTEAHRLAEQWWTAIEVKQIFPDDAATRLFLKWIDQYSLGRKRLIDTLLAATFRIDGISSILTLNPSDFAVFGGFTCIIP